MTKKILVIFNMQIGDYEHSDQYIFDKEMTEYQYCKKFWSLSKKNELIYEDKTHMWDIGACLENAKLDLDMDIQQQANEHKRII